MIMDSKERKTFWTFMPQSLKEVEKMLEKRQPIIQCWFCGKQHTEEFYGLKSTIIPDKKDYMAFTGEAIKFKTGITNYTLKSKNFGDLKIGVCQTCRFTILEIVQAQSLVEDREKDLLYL